MVDVDKLVAEVSPRYRKRDGKPKGPNSSHQLIYDSSTETLEPLYFWILDFVNGMFRKVEKIDDTFASSPGSGHFSELQGKSSQMQQEASRILGTINTILKGVINLIYDLKEFKIRLSHYDAVNSKDQKEADAGFLALKQIWMDRVDSQRGIGSINALSSGDLSFVTLRDAFLIVKSQDDINKLDLNERVLRILKPRLQEFLEWKKRSEQELRKRYEIEKIYLKSQVDSLKLNAKWAKPYLKSAELLMQSDALSSNPALVTVFNTLILDLTLMGINPVNLEDAVLSKTLPPGTDKMTNLRKYNSVVFIEFKFRGIPSKAGQHYTFGGRAEVNFKSYALTDDEIELFKIKLEDSDMNNALKLVQGMTDDSLKQLDIDISELLEDKKDNKPKDTDPFSALFSIVKVEKKKEKKEESKQDKIKRLSDKIAKKENFLEKYIRTIAEANAINNNFTIYDIYKKSHGMPAFPYREDASAKVPKTSAEKIFGV